MKKTLLSLTALAALTMVGTVQAFPVKLVAYNQRTASAFSTLKWDGCTTYTSTTACINPANNNLSGMGITPSTAVWDWNPTTGVLSMTGDFNAASTLGSSGNAVANTIIGDRVSNLTIDTVSKTSTASAYQCAEGTFLAGVGANGCLNLNLGDNGVVDSTALYNVGGNANCVQRTLGGDDVSTGGPRILMTSAGGGGCDAGDGAFDLWTVVKDELGTGGQLIIANDIPIADANTAYLTFDALPHAVDDTADVLPAVATSINVLANDLALTDPVTVEIDTQGTKGTATPVASPGNIADVRISYTSNVGETGADTFKYKLTVGTTVSTATVTVAILNVGANPDTANTTRNKPVAINVGANDTGFTGDVTITQVGSCDQGGNFTAGAAGPVATASINYTPSSIAGSPGYTEICTYQITDGTLTDTATVTVTVANNVPNAPNAGSITISTVGANPSTTSGTLNVATISGNNAGDAPITVTGTAGKGTVTATGSTLTYTPSASFFEGSDVINYTITDGDGETTTGTANVTIANATPALAAASITTKAGTASAATALTITAGNGALTQHTLAVTTNGTSGSCALTGTSVVYTSNAGSAAGSDSCVITVTDGDGSSSTGTVNVTVTAAGGGSGGGNVLPGGSSALDLWSLGLLGTGIWLRRKRKAA